MRVIALDIGDRRIGVAFSSTFIANPVETYTRVATQKDLEYLAEVVRAHKAEQIVAGLPKNMDGSEGFQATKARDFAAALGEMTGVEVIMWDERLTSVTANQLLTQTGVKGQKRKQHVDKIAAVLILQNYLDAKGFGI